MAAVPSASFIVCKPFPSPGEDESIDTKEFLSACVGILEFITMLGAVFSPVRHDVSANVAKVRARFDADPIANASIQSLVRSEMASVRPPKTIGMATEGLLWLKRGLEYCSEMLNQLVLDFDGGNSAESITDPLRKAYERTLKQRHNWAIRRVFGVMVHAAPYRSTLIAALGEGDADLGSEAAIVAAIRDYLRPFRANLGLIHALLTQFKLEDELAKVQR